MNHYESVAQKAKEYFSPETISSLVADDMIYHYRYMMDYIKKVDEEFANFEPVSESKHSDYMFYKKMTGAFRIILKEYYGVNLKD